MEWTRSLRFFLLVPVIALTCIAKEPTAAANPEKEKCTVVTIKTNKGDIKVELADDKAPITVKNFLQYVDDGYFNGTVFHRVIPNFMIQGGGFTPDGVQKPTRAPIKNEADNGLKNTRGTLAMARTGVIDSATSQFFINLKDNGFLDHTAKTPRGYGYCVFGKVIEGLEVVDEIAGVSTARRGMHENWPTETIRITEIVRAE